MRVTMRRMVLKSTAGGNMELAIASACGIITKRMANYEANCGKAAKLEPLPS